MINDNATRLARLLKKQRDDRSIRWIQAEIERLKGAGFVQKSVSTKVIIDILRGKPYTTIKNKIK